jgi:MoxR-like ATPase
MSDPFLVLATQNPIEQEGTYPLPEAQQDRFMFKVLVTYPSFDEEFEVARRTTTGGPAEVDSVLSPDEIRDLQEVVRAVPISDHLIRYTLALVRQTRVREPGVADFAREQLAWGAGPRATQYLILGAKARALVHGRAHATIEDIQAVAKPVLRHRLVVNFAAESDGITTDHIIDRLLEVTPTHEDQLLRDNRFQKMFAS